eukprot:scaffold77016_cov60-Phaeocystis_antarctica.AAC.3
MYGFSALPRRHSDHLAYGLRLRSSATELRVRPVGAGSATGRCGVAAGRGSARGSAPARGPL